MMMPSGPRRTKQTLAAELIFMSTCVLNEASEAHDWMDERVTDCEPNGAKHRHLPKTVKRPLAESVVHLPMTGGMR